MSTKKDTKKRTTPQRTHKKTHHDSVLGRFYATFRRSLSAPPVSYLYVTLYDAFFYVALALAAMLIGGLARIQSSALKEKKEALSQLEASSVPALQQLVERTLYTLLGIIGLYIIVGILLFAVFKGLIWNRLLDRESTLHSLKRYAGLSGIWVVGGIILVFILPPLLLKESVLMGAMFVLLLLYLHMSFIVYITLARTMRVLHALGQGIELAFKKLHHFILPYAIICLLYGALLTILSVPFYFFPQGTMQTLPVQLFIGLVSLVYFAWARTYIVEVYHTVIHDEHKHHRTSER